ncbi:TPA: hypothetical protein ACXNF8_000716 [Pseudomonas aeruginosa]
MRDKQNNFKPSTLRKLKNRVGNVCSNPSCYAPTSGAKTGEEEGELNMGIGAHICAASPGGPRYVPHMTPAQRSAYKNGIWLCIPCSYKIDKDPTAYPAELLYEWKKTAEQRSQAKIGIPAQPDSAPQDLLLTALSGMPIKSGIAQAINNVHGAVERAFSALDDRFQVKTVHKSGQTIFHITPRENLKVPLTLELKNPKRYLQGYRQLIEEGKSLIIDTYDVNLTGSPLFEKIATESSKLEIGSPSRACTLRVSTIDKSTQNIETFNDISGNLYFGTVSGTFTGFAMERMLKIEISINLQNRNKPNITITPYTEYWNGLPITDLPYFSKIKNLLLNINNGHVINLTLEHKGEKILSASSEPLSFKDQFKNIEMLFLYLDAARVISRFTNTTILFDDTQTIPGEDIDRLIAISSMIEGTYIKLEKDLSKPIQFKLTKEDNISDQLKIIEKDVDLQLRNTQKEKETVSIFGKSIKMPRKTLELTRVRIKILNRETISTDNDIACEIIPMENFSLKIFYLSETDSSTGEDLPNSPSED